MFLTRLRFWVLLLMVGPLCVMGAQLSAAAQGATAPRETLSDELTSLASRAALVFAGQVVSIARKGGVVEITFRVDQPVVGTPGASFKLKEWAGMWPPGQFRYTVGERALVFLHGVSAAGFASSVDGPTGVVPVVVHGANAPQLLDIRRLAAATLRAPGTPLPTQADGAIQLSEAVTLVQAAPRPGVTARLKPGYRLPFHRFPLGNPLSGSGATLEGTTSSAAEPLPLKLLTVFDSAHEVLNVGGTHVAQ